MGNSTFDMRAQVTIKTIQLAVAELFGLSLAELKEHTNKRAVAVPRQIAMYLCKQITEVSSLEIGRHFGGKHYKTVTRSIAKINEQRQTNVDMDRVLRTLLERFQSKQDD